MLDKNLGSTVFTSANDAWKFILEQLLTCGKLVHGQGSAGASGRDSYEVMNASVTFSIEKPIITYHERRLNYKFMAAEAYWICTGSDKVDDIAPYCSKIAAYSDDGVTFFGAYGPRFFEEFDTALSKLLQDRNTRQSVITIWRKNPPNTKDTPCTLNIVFSIRDNKLHSHVHMRSSDAWMGVPYDFFNYSMMTIMMACAYNAQSQDKVELGSLCWSAVSSHIYSNHVEDARKIVDSGTTGAGDRIYGSSVAGGDFNVYLEFLKNGRDSSFVTL